ncbi:DUF4263 domain-containing protein [Geomonas paludis]|uniref:DUF4263 domain-containing protein n=1 Tax=Geomonas paludis TaxID=2740185 RepID=A0ABY4LD56_9BACT|nr:Shedu anti-phage system protein SduA domain-containing protein [Geomonas paludis]UPU34493.1 DUF4263 domain-containing protein [Geomonas paludis]
MDTIYRRPAKSAPVSYSDPVVLHDSSRSRITLIPFFIQHSDHTEFAAKIVTYKKQRPPLDWSVIEEKSVTFTGESLQKLLPALRSHLRVSEEGADGEYLVIRVQEGTANLGTHDPASVASALAKVLGQQEIVKHLQETELSTELVKALKASIRLSEMRSAIAALRNNLDSEITDEGTYQKWCESHSWAFGNAYVMRDQVRMVSPGDQLDLLLPTVIAGYRDIVELKRPDMPVLKYDLAHRNYYFSSDVSKAIGQCHRYLDVLHDEAAKGLRDHPDIVAYHPRAVIVIGRSSKWETGQHRALHGLNRRLSGVTIMTYDHLLAQGERLIEVLSAPQPDAEEYQETEVVDDDWGM